MGNDATKHEIQTYPAFTYTPAANPNISNRRPSTAVKREGAGGSCCSSRCCYSKSHCTGNNLVYKGTLVQQGILEEPDWFKVQYEDGDAEWMSLSTLETDGTLGLQGTAERRVKWCLSEHTVVTNGLLSQATGACVMQSNKDAGEANADLQGEVAQAQSEINAGNKRPTRAAKTRAQDALGGAAVAPAPTKESQKTRTKRKKAGAAADGAGKSNQVDKEPKNKNKQTPKTKATPAARKIKAQQTPADKDTPAAGDSTRGAK